jgi:hypothetical protein
VLLIRSSWLARASRPRGVSVAPEHAPVRDHRGTTVEPFEHFGERLTSSREEELVNVINASQRASQRWRLR